MYEQVAYLAWRRPEKGGLKAKLYRWPTLIQVKMRLVLHQSVTDMREKLLPLGDGSDGLEMAGGGVSAGRAG